MVRVCRFFISASISSISRGAVLTGHVHESPFKPDGGWADLIGATWVFNAGNQIGKVPAHVVVDLGANEAIWQSMLGTERVDLDAASVPTRSVF